jgi:hypothetical protein
MVRWCFNGKWYFFFIFFFKSFSFHGAIIFSLQKQIYFFNLFSRKKIYLKFILSSSSYANWMYNSLTLVSKVEIRAATIKYNISNTFRKKTCLHINQFNFVLNLKKIITKACFRKCRKQLIGQKVRK